MAAAVFDSLSGGHIKANPVREDSAFLLGLQGDGGCLQSDWIFLEPRVRNYVRWNDEIRLGPDQQLRCYQPGSIGCYGNDAGAGHSVKFVEPKADNNN